jgi:hypothetical protein
MKQEMKKPVTAATVDGLPISELFSNPLHTVSIARYRSPQAKFSDQRRPSLPANGVVERSPRFRVEEGAVRERGLQP